MSVEASKNNLASELFVRTADENYITARWCANNQLNTDFLWLAVHALEKYLKAVLLVNGHDTRG
jgi:HEPN domain-containing protein